MGSFDGVKCCDIVGLSLLSPLQGQGLNVGLYQDDLLAASRLTKLQNKIAKQKICRISAANGLEITGTEANKKTVDFLEVGGEQRRNQEFRFRFRQCRYRNFWQEKAREFVIL